MGTLYNLCFSSIIVLRIYIHNIVYIIRFVNMFNLCFGFDLAWFGIWLDLEKLCKRSGSTFIRATLSYVTNLPGRAAGFYGILLACSLQIYVLCFRCYD